MILYCLYAYMLNHFYAFLLACLDKHKRYYLSALLLISSFKILLIYLCTYTLMCLHAYLLSILLVNRLHTLLIE